jgi:hypothetical protein
VPSAAKREKLASLTLPTLPTLPTLLALTQVTQVEQVYPRLNGTLIRPMQKHKPEKNCNVYHWVNDFEIGKQYMFRRSIRYRTESPHATEDCFVSDGKSSDNQELCSSDEKQSSHRRHNQHSVFALLEANKRQERFCIRGSKV